jgi:hypothetical protein
MTVRARARTFVIHAITEGYVLVFVMHRHGGFAFRTRHRPSNSGSGWMVHSAKRAPASRTHTI